MELSELVKSLQSFKGVSRKNSIEKVTKTLGDVYNITGDVLLDFGDDASAIDIGDNQVVLLAADGIWGDLMNVDPYWAGYCAVLVNVNDIAAMGGKPIAMVNIMAVDNEEIYEEILSGIVDGCRKFNVPMVGGHLHPDAEYNSLDVAIAGIASKDSLITSSGAKVGDKVLVAIDTDGRQYPGIPLNWDTTYEKDAKLVQDQIKVMQKIAEEHLPSAGKDISNPGTLGTLEMLLESSGVGASVELEKIPRNENVDWDMWLRAYPGAAFVMTAPEENAQAIIDALSPYSFEVAVIGEVIEEKKLYLSSGDEKLVLFDQNSNPVLVMNQQVY
ncbi:MAG: methanogenesis marker 2 protein [Methanobrevibacter sp.]|nr:methanogenesis marker 2 protein [Methanobrevibacter sp.]